MTSVQALLTERDAFLETGELSTDYLNRYNEALMLLEMSAMDASMVDDLRAWKPLGYTEHFEQAGLRCGPGAIGAYHRLMPVSRMAFEHLCAGMDRLVRTVLQAFDQMKDPDDAVFVVDIAVGSFRSMLTRATAFINTGGDLAAAAFDEAELQTTVDQLIAG